MRWQAKTRRRSSRARAARSSASERPMPLRTDDPLLHLFGGVVALLVTATVIGAALRRYLTAPDARVMVDNINARIRAWWVMALVFMASVTTGTVGSILLFALISFLAL